MHAVLFAKAMAATGLDPTYGAYLAQIPAITLATVNFMSLCGLHRRLRGAIVGHLAAFEMTSSLPNRRYGNGLRRLGFGVEATDFFDEHVEADAVHEQIAAWDLAGGLAAAEPELAPDVLFGARALLVLEARWARAPAGGVGARRALAVAAAGVSDRLPISYVLPLRMADAGPRAELAAYLRELVGWCEEVIVVDGSAPELFAGNAAAWPAGVRQLAPDPAHRCLNGKVAGVHTGIEQARHEHVVLADDDVRYRRPSSRAMAALLADHDLVQPQNVFDPLPWHARWDTARTLLNRSLGADYPGTLALRRSRFLRWAAMTATSCSRTSS